MRGALLFVTLSFLSVVSALAWAEQNGAASMTETASAGNGATDIPSHPPQVRQQVVEDTLHGVTIRDPYRYLEDSNNPETQRYVTEELAYTRKVLDPLPGRGELHARLQ